MFCVCLAAWPVGLEVLFSLRVREVPSSILGCPPARLRIFLGAFSPGKGFASASSTVYKYGLEVVMQRVDDAAEDKTFLSANLLTE